jgi:hypothetical protein
LKKQLIQTKKQILEYSQNFADRYGRFIDLHTRIERSMDRFSFYRVFSSLENSSKENIKKLYYYLKFWELNQSNPAVPEKDIIRAIRILAYPEKEVSLLREYYQNLKKTLFDLGIKIKTTDEFLHYQETITGYRSELQALRIILNKYRDFLIKTDPNPYVRSRLGFPEWIVGPEPHHVKQLRHLDYDAENLDNLFVSISQAIQKAGLEESAPFQPNEDMQKVIHEMGQPLISKNLMKSNAERLVNMMQQFNELGSTHKEAIDYIGQILSKAMRLDWKYQTLFDIPAFHEVYAIHHGLIGAYEERQHLNRMHKFKRYIQQIEQWVKTNDTPRHTYEIETDIHDIKGYLQDFFAQVQRLIKDEGKDKEAVKDKITQIRHQLLEYRYLFGNFFHHLRLNKSEDRMIRRQFLFVDQYFESIESKLHDWQYA